MNTKGYFLLLAFIIGLLSSMFLTACGAGGKKPVTTINVDMTDHKITPDAFTVPAGAEISINLKNSGKQHHEFRILVLGAKVDEDVEKDGNSTRYWSTILLPGDSKPLSFIAPSEPGRYVIKCSAPGHTEAVCLLCRIHAHIAQLSACSYKEDLWHLVVGIGARLVKLEEV